MLSAASGFSAALPMVSALSTASGAYSVAESQAISPPADMTMAAMSTPSTFNIFLSMIFHSVKNLPHSAGRDRAD